MAVTSVDANRLRIQSIDAKRGSVVFEDTIPAKAQLLTAMISPGGLRVAIITVGRERPQSELIVYRIDQRRVESRRDLTRKESLDQGAWLSDSELFLTSSGLRPRYQMWRIGPPYRNPVFERTIQSFDAFQTQLSYQQGIHLNERAREAGLIPTFVVAQTGRRRFWSFTFAANQDSYFDVTSRDAYVIGKRGGSQGFWYVGKEGAPILCVEGARSIMEGFPRADAFYALVLSAKGRPKAVKFDANRKSVLWTIECDRFLVSED